MELKNKVAIVTGSAEGIGKAIAAAFIEEGAKVVIADINYKKATETANEFGNNAYAVKVDVTDSAQVKNMVKDSLDHFKKIDILVNNAGLNIRRPSTDVSQEDWDTVLNTNLKGSFFCAQAAAKEMIKRKHGRIINVGSCTCVFGMEGIAPYTASRGAILSMTRSLAAEWGKFGITVNVLAPGWFKTAQNAVLYENKEWVDYITERIPLNRPGQPHDLDGTVIFLASDASEYITGQIILVDGGFTTGATKAIT